MAVKIQFAQGLNVGNIGEALIGVAASPVVASDGNYSPGSVSHYRWTWIDVPTLSTIPLGFITEGPVPSISFTPDVEGDYHLLVEAFSVTGFKTVDRRVFRVELGSGRALPAFDAEADALNFGGQTRGWKPDMEAWLLYLEALVSPGMSSSGVVNTLQVAGAVAGTFVGATNVKAGNTWISWGAGTIPSSGYLRFQQTTGALITGRVAAGDAIILRQSGDQLQLADDTLWHLYAGARSIVMWSRYANGELYGGSIAATQIFTWNENGVQIGGVPAFGGGTNVLGLRAATVNPGSNPAGSVAIYCDLSDGYTVKYRKPSGEIIPLDVYVDPCTTDFRLSAASGVAVPPSDIASTSTIYLTPFCGNMIALYNGSRWVMRQTNEVPLALAGLTNGFNYDVFAYWNGSAVVLELSAAWNTDTSRSQSIVRLNGTWVKGTDNTRRLVGTIRATGTNTTTDTMARRFVWSADNQRRRVLYRQETALSWTCPAGASFRQANLNAANCVEWVQGVADLVTLDVQCQYRSSVNGFGVQCAIGIDSTTVLTPPQLSGAITNRDDVANAGSGYANAKYAGYSLDGYHKANWLERWGGATTITFYSTIQVGPPDWGAGGLIGWIDA